MSKEYFEDIEFTDNCGVIGELNKLCDMLTSKGMARVRHDSTTRIKQDRTEGQLVQNIATKTVEIDNEIFYDVFYYEPFSIFDPFRETMQKFDVRFWYNYKRNWAGVKLSRSGLIQLIGMFASMLSAQYKLTNNGKLDINNVINLVNIGLEAQTGYPKLMSKTIVKIAQPGPGRSESAAPAPVKTIPDMDQ